MNENSTGALNHFKYDISIIIPAFNEENRIMNTLGEIRNYLSKKNIIAEIIVVNDGSADGTISAVEKIRPNMKNLTLLNLTKNLGKGHAIKKGIEASQGEYALFMDADSSTPIDELEKLSQALKEGGADIAIGSRYIKGSRVKIGQSLSRIMIGRIGNLLIRLFLIHGIRDTQCGFKLFRHNVAQNIFSRQRVKRWGFDMEVLAIARMLNLKIIEIPVSWVHSSESRMRPIRDSLKTLIELVYIKINLWRGRY